MSDNGTILGTKIVVLGVGGCGNNAVNRLLEENIENVDFYVLNTESKTLLNSKVDPKNKIVLGEKITKGLGAGGDPEIGKKAAEASIDAIKSIVKGANMVFIAAGMGGGTGSGAAPIIASICRDEGILTFAIVTRPFGFEGPRRKTIAVSALKNLANYVDSYVVVSNDKLLMNNGSETIQEAFRISDKVLFQSVKTIIDLILVPGIINLDFADIKSTLKDSGVTLIGYGEGKGATRVNDAINMVLSPSILETDITGAKKAICAITCGKDVSLYEAQECVEKITETAQGCQDIKFGISIDQNLNDVIKISLIASSFNDSEESSDLTLENTLTNFQNEEKEENKPNNIINDLTKVKEKAIENNADEEDEDDILPSFLKNR